MLEAAHAAFAFSSGMAALNSVTRLLSSGDEMLVGSDIYGGMHRLVSRVTSMHGITVRKVDVTDVDAVRAAITDRTRMLHFESPSNPLMQIADVRALAKVCEEAKVIMSIDASMVPPVLMQCIPLGADIVVHSATKFLAGHSDTMAGVVCCRTEELAKRVAFYQNAEGTGLAPFDCWLVLRGIKTMALRVERAQSNAEQIALKLRKHPRVTAVHYAGLRPLAPDEEKALIIGKRAALSNSEVVKRRQLTADRAKPGAGAAAAPLGIRHPSDSLLEYLRVDIDKTHPLPTDEELEDRYVHGMAAYDTHFKQASGGGTVMSFTTGSVHLSQRIVDALRMFKLTVSFGSCNSLVEMPCVLSHASVPAEQRELAPAPRPLSPPVAPCRPLSPPSPLPPSLTLRPPSSSAPPAAAAHAHPLRSILMLTGGRATIVLASCCCAIVTGLRARSAQRVRRLVTAPAVLPSRNEPPLLFPAAVPPLSQGLSIRRAPCCELSQAPFPRTWSACPWASRTCATSSRTSCRPSSSPRTPTCTTYAWSPGRGLTLRRAGRPARPWRLPRTGPCPPLRRSRACGGSWR